MMICTLISVMIGSTVNVISSPALDTIDISGDVVKYYDGNMPNTYQVVGHDNISIDGDDVIMYIGKRTLKYKCKAKG